MQIAFHGAAQTVTGSKHLITLEGGERILLDCGMFQGMGAETDDLNRHFGFNPAQVDHVILTHAHIDHSGLLPRLIKQGYAGKVYCTEATADICSFMLMDSAHIIEADVAFVNKRRTAQGKPKLEPLYTEDDAKAALDRLVPLPVDRAIAISERVEVQLIPNGHILGSAMAHLTLKEDGRKVRLAFSGDVGRYDAQLMPDPHSFPQADVILCESTYGDRLHPIEIDPGQELLEAITDTCVRRRGKVIIPAFSLGRTQEIVYALSRLEFFGLLPDVRIYVDSPLAQHATDATREHLSLLNDEVRDFAQRRPDPFRFPQLSFIPTREASQHLNESKEPCVIISSSGMAEAGRVKHHILHNVGNEANTILIVGYAGPYSLAGRLRAGEKSVRIFGDEYEVRAEVRVIQSYSAHGDQKELMRWLSCQDARQVGELFLVHGEPEYMLELKKHLHGMGFSNIHMPIRHQVYDV